MLIAAEEKFYRQRSRVLWHHLGDRDTKFYHKTVIQRAHCNHIHFLKTENDVVIGAFEDIKAHSVDFFASTLGSTSLPESLCFVGQIQDLLPFRCSDLQCCYLKRKVAEVEIKNTLFAMPLDKSPRPDGYSIEFFRSSWSIIGKDRKKEQHLFKWVDEALLDEIQSMHEQQSRIAEEIEDLRSSLKKTVKEAVIEHKKLGDVGLIGSILTILCLSSKFV
ncbi:hypothetical protein F2Q69_00004807 [Brassica cretica]|uniref:Uncharacterized protein n=1 Tax=Brassica cretica TaxID=69181 RepID=A0A8S9PFZ8_BRACR|nr:hypothetical protein F2Q69_00004807 [Brassica cretica]